MKFLWLPAVLAAFAFASGNLGSTTGTTKIYVTNSQGDDITVIDLPSRKVTDDIRVGRDVHGVCAPADARRLFTTVESEKNLKIIDTANDEITATISLTGTPNQCASTPDGRYIDVPIRDGNSVDIVDTEQRKVVKVLPVHEPHNGYDANDNQRIFVSSMGDHEIDLIDLQKMDYIAKIPVGGIPRPYVVSNDEKTVYSALTDFHGFVIASVPERKVIARVELPPAPPADCVLEPHTPTHGLALTPDGRELWVTSLGDSGVYVYDVATKKISSEVPVGKCPNWITVTPDGRYVAVSNSDSDDTSIIDEATHHEIARIKVGKSPKRLLALQVPSN
jgi:YVTN family beta-propeller protein